MSPLPGTTVEHHLVTLLFMDPLMGAGGSSADSKSGVPGSSPSCPDPPSVLRWNRGPCTRSSIEPHLPALQEIPLPQYSDCLFNRAGVLLHNCLAGRLGGVGMGSQSKRAKPGQSTVVTVVTPSFQRFTEHSTAHTNTRSCLIVSSVQSSLDVRPARIWPLPSAYCLSCWGCRSPVPCRTEVMRCHQSTVDVVTSPGEAWRNRRGGWHLNEL